MTDNSEITTQKDKTEQSTAEVKECDSTLLDSERKFLEELFSKRFNYYSLFAAAFLFIIFQEDFNKNIYLVKIWLCSGALIFLLMFFSIWRTNNLIDTALDKLENIDSAYKELSNNTKKTLPFRSNHYLVFISFLLFLLVFILAVLSFTCEALFVSC